MFCLTVNLVVEHAFKVIDYRHSCTQLYYVKLLMLRLHYFIKLLNIGLQKLASTIIYIFGLYYIIHITISFTITVSLVQLSNLIGL